MLTVPGGGLMCLHMVEALGLEPRTLGLKVRCSKPTELYFHVLTICKHTDMFHYTTAKYWVILRGRGFDPLDFNVFAYGRGTENRTLITWLKATYFSR